MNSKKLKRIVAGMLVFTLALISPMQYVKSQAAGKSVKYIKEFKLFIQKEGTLENAKSWCEAQTEGDWHVVEGDLNSGTDGTFTKPVGVFMCYCTTENEKEAVRDIAVMNEKGNYSESAYEEILKSQKDAYSDLVKDLCIQIKGYQENLKNNVKTAVEARDLLNGYKEDDSGKLLGDLLAELDPDQQKDAETLTDILLQANGNVVLFIQQELSLACENGTRSWLDRMEQAGGYDNFYAKIKNAFKGDDVLAKKNMDTKYKEKATVIADSWDGLKSHLDDIKKYEEKCGILSMTDEQVKEWKANNAKTAEGMIYEQESALAANLARYKYDGKTLLDFFLQDKAAVSGENLYKLYPMAACLQAGQVAGIDSTVNLYSLANQAFTATLLNDYEKGKLKEEKDVMKAGEKKSLSDAQQRLENLVEKGKDDEVKSVYEGVEREMFDGGVAVTSEALEYSKGSETKWSDYFYNNQFRINIDTVIGLCAGVFGTIIFCGLTNNVLDSKALQIVEQIHVGGYTDKFSPQTIELLTIGSRHGASGEQSLLVVEQMAENGEHDAQAAIQSLYKVAADESVAGKILNGLMIGFAVVTVLVAVADIAINAVALYQYYNRDHLPKPKYMVDMSTNRDKETSYVTYKAVMDDFEKPGDLNGGSCKQWLAMYQTYDERAGKPIAAPESGYPMTVCYGGAKGKDDQMPLHVFGKPNSAQNLTYSDGENGWSYNDKNNGTYFFFTRYDGRSVEENGEKATQAGTTMSGGMIALIGVGVAGAVVIVFLVAYTSRKRKRRDD